MQGIIPNQAVMNAVNYHCGCFEVSSIALYLRKSSRIVDLTVVRKIHKMKTMNLAR